MTRISLEERLSQPPARIPPSAVGSAAGRCPPVAGRPRPDSAPLTPAYEFRTVRLPRPRHLHRRARRWASWHPVDRLGAWVHDVGLFVLAVVAVSVWAASLVGTAVLVGGAS